MEEVILGVIMNEMAMAVKNLGRNTKRTVLTLLTISVGLTALMILGGYYEYNYWGLKESLIRSQLGHIQIYPEGYRKFRDSDPYNSALADLQGLTAFLENLPGVAVVSPHQIFWGVVDAGPGGSSLVEVRGVLPEKENIINTFFTYKSGRDLSVRDPLGAEIGKTLAQNLKLEPKADFYLSTITPQGEQNVLMLRTQGVIGSYSQDFDARILRVPLETAKGLTGFSGVQELIILLKDENRLAETMEAIRTKSAALGWNLEVTSWQDHAGYYLQVVEFYGGYFRIMLFIVTLVSFFSTFNALLMAFFERITEVGTLRSFGAPNTSIARMMVLEGLVLGFAGTLGAYGFSGILVLIITFMGGVPMPPPPGLTTSVSVMIRLSPGLFLLAGVIGLSVPLLASVFPIIKTLRMPILDQIRFNER